MRTTQVRLALVAVAIAAAPLAGCTTVVDGTASCPGCGTATEPTISTNRPEAHPPTAPSTTTSAGPTPTTGPKPGATTLPADGSGLVFVETKSGKTRCQLSTSSVDCESDFDNAPTKDGVKANGVSVNTSGTLTWVVGNLGAIPVVTLGYQTYSANGWTIDATSDGTRFTNDNTGHGMQVATQGVQAF